MPVEHKLRRRAREVHVAHQRQRAVVQDEPIAIDTRCQHGVIFIWEIVLQDDDLHIVFGEAGLEQRELFDDGVVFAIAAAGSKRLERRAPVVLDAPLRVVAGGADREIDCPVDQADSGTTASPGAFRAQIIQSLRNDGAGIICAATLQALELTRNLCPRAGPFLRDRASDQRSGLHAEQRSRPAIGADRRW